MTASLQDSAPAPDGGERAFFPLIRHISARTTPVLLVLGLSPNAITLLGLAAGALAAVCLAQGDYWWGQAGAVLFFLAGLMDHCDGEVARATGRTSRMGAFLDDLADWGTHAAFFAGLGIGASRINADEPHGWVWAALGFAAAFGATANWFGLWWRARKRRQAGRPGETKVILKISDTRTRGEWWLFAYREICRVDFWILVFLLQAMGVLWMLLPLAAVGAQAYWILGFLKAADEFGT